MTAVLGALAPRDASAQLGALVSPGPLHRTHASLEGITGCLQCHTVGRGVSASKCLGCHAPVAQRIAQKQGIHKAVTDDCVACHVEHAGADAELRPFDLTRFDHQADTGFALDGLHAPIASDCAKCHTTRSFLTASQNCASCHEDAHKGTLGADCATCHTTAVGFAQTKARFDHGRTAFPLTGAHTKTDCASCHAPGTYAVKAFGSCASCHTDPHTPRFDAACATCHTTDTWRTTRVDHSRTAFPLRGLHADVRCVSCHQQPALRASLPSATCASCHDDPHDGVFPGDCATCHTEDGFRKVTPGGFDHSSTRFPLVDRHAELGCVACHTDPEPAGRPRATSAAAPPAAARAFTGLDTTCVSCHVDVHRGELGTSCETCHAARTFEVGAFSHARPRPFFDGEHADLTCAQCHSPEHGGTTGARLLASSDRAPDAIVRVGFTATPDTCGSCHMDVHLGQVGERCETCHAVETPAFGVASFDHGTTTFALDGAHAPLLCESCHAVETGAFPAGHGTARRLTGIGTDCVSCHQDPHDGELGMDCSGCHGTRSFSILRYTHRNARALRDFFVGRHVTSCQACHKRQAIAGQRVMTLYRESTACTACHVDEHRGALGPQCERCHRP